MSPINDTTTTCSLLSYATTDQCMSIVMNLHRVVSITYRLVLSPVHSRHTPNTIKHNRTKGNNFFSFLYVTINKKKTPGTTRPFIDFFWHITELSASDSELSKFHH